MTLQSSGQISMSDINVELGHGASSYISLNDADARNLAGKASGIISLSDFYGKSNVVGPTRFYLRSSGAPPTYPGCASPWTSDVTGVFLCTMGTTKTGTALTTASFSESGSLFSSFRRRMGVFVSEPLAAQTITGNVSYVIGKCYEGSSGCNAYLAVVISIIDGTTGVKKSTVYSMTVSGSNVEFPTTAGTRISSPTSLTTQTCVAGDRLAAEIGVYENTISARSTIQMRFGDPQGVEDFALTSGLTTDLVSWIEFANGVVFQ